MSDHKNTILAIVLSLIVIVGWQYFIGYPQVERQRQQTQQETQQQTQLNQQLLAWETVYNTVRPHQALGYLTPEEFIRQWHVQHAS